MKPNRAFVAERALAQHCSELLGKTVPTAGELLPRLSSAGERFAKALAPLLAPFAGGGSRSRSRRRPRLQLYLWSRRRRRRRRRPQRESLPRKKRDLQIRLPSMRRRDAGRQKDTSLAFRKAPCTPRNSRTRRRLPGSNVSKGNPGRDTETSRIRRARRVP